MSKKYHESSLWTETDDFIEEVAEWMNCNLAKGDEITVDIRITTKEKKKSTFFTRHTL